MPGSYYQAAAEQEAIKEKKLVDAKREEMQEAQSRFYAMFSQGRSRTEIQQAETAFDSAYRIYLKAHEQYQYKVSREALKDITNSLSVQTVTPGLRLTMKA